MSKEKKPGKREQLRAMKDAIRGEIFELRDKIKAALTAPPAYLSE